MGPLSKSNVLCGDMNDRARNWAFNRLGLSSFEPKFGSNWMGAGVGVPIIGSFG